MAFTKPNKVRTIIAGFGLPIEVDVVVSQNHKSKKTYTRYPVEFGRSANDNAIQEPDEVELNIILSDTKIGTDYSPAGTFEGRSRALYGQLLLWQRLSSPIVLITGTRSYSGMYIEDLVINKNSPERSLNLTILFVELINVFSGLAELAAAALVDNDIAYSATDNINLGVI